MQQVIWHVIWSCSILLYLNILSSWVGKANILELNSRYQFLQLLSTLGARVYWWYLREFKKGMGISHDIHEHITIHRSTADANVGLPQFINMQLWCMATGQCLATDKKIPLSTPTQITIVLTMIIIISSPRKPIWVPQEWVDTCN